MRFTLVEEIIIESKADQERFKEWIGEKGEDYFNLFTKFKQKIKSPQVDMYWWMKNSTPEEFIGFIDDIVSSDKTDKDTIQKEKDGARLVYQDKDWKVYEITNYEASAKYGKGTKWCISGSKRWANGGEGSKFFDNYYNHDGVRFYFFINGSDKWALAIYPDGKNYEIFNAQDVKVPYIPDAPVVDEINVDYRNSNDMNVLSNAILSQKIDEGVILNTLDRALSDDGDFKFMEFRRLTIDELIDVLDDSIPDGYCEYRAVEDGKLTPEEYEEITGEEFDDFWGGDFPAFDEFESDVPFAKTREETLSEDNLDFGKYWLSIADEEEWVIVNAEDWVGLMLEADTFSKRHFEEGIGDRLANQLIDDIKDGTTPISVIEDIGLSKEFLDSLR